MVPSSQPIPRDTIRPSTVSAAGGAAVTIRGSGFVNGAGLTLNRKTATVTRKDANTLSATVPGLAPVGSESASPIPTVKARVVL